MDSIENFSKLGFNLKLLVYSRNSQQVEKIAKLTGQNLQINHKTESNEKLQGSFASLRRKRVLPVESSSSSQETKEMDLMTRMYSKIDYSRRSGSRDYQTVELAKTSELGIGHEKALEQISTKVSILFSPEKMLDKHFDV